MMLLTHSPHAEIRIETFRTQLTSEEPLIKLAAATGLVQAGQSSESLTALKELLDSGNEFVRHATLLSIDEAGPAVIDPLRTFLTAGKDEEYGRRLCEHALNQLSAP
jgi:HEAT repeat protein